MIIKIKLNFSSTNVYSDTTNCWYSSSIYVNISR
nr:MAG TPA: hypothetical protein [Caudoviricetes sp.]